MSPEQCQGIAADFRCDIYSMACVFYEALCGEPPFKGATALQTMHMQLHESPSSIYKQGPDLPNYPKLDAVFLKALAKNPQARFKSATLFKEELLDALDSSQTNVVTHFFAHIARMRRRSAASRRQSKALIVATAVVALAATGFGVYIVSGDTNQIGQADFDKGNYGAAEMEFRLGTTRGDDKVKLGSWLNRQDLYHAQGKSKEEEEAAAQAHQLESRLFGVNQDDLTATFNSDKDKYAEQVNHIATICIVRGEHEKAEKLIDKCLAIANEISPVLRERTLLNGSNIKLAIGKFDEAQTLANRAYELSSKPELQYQKGNAEVLQAYVAWQARDDYAGASDWLEKSIQFYISQLRPNSLQEADARLLLGRMLAAQKQEDKAMSELQIAERIFNQLSLSDSDGQADFSKADISTKLEEIKLCQARLLFEQKDDVSSYDRADILVTQAIKNLERTNVRTEQQDRVLAELLRLRAHWNQSEHDATLSRSVAILYRLRGCESTDYALSLTESADQLANAKSYAQAKTTYLQALKYAREADIRTSIEKKLAAIEKKLTSPK
jgi:tetratricopeptide (TPR) repeat protein